MKLRIIIALFLTTTVLFSFKKKQGVIGTVFPELTGTTLTDKKVTIPKDTKGKSTLIAMAFSSDAEEALKTWADPTYELFIDPNQLQGYDINLYFIPIFSGAKAALAESAREKFKKENDPVLHPYVLIYRGEMDKYKTALGMDKKSIPYIFVLDTNGKVVYSTTGSYTEAKMDAIEDAID